MASKCLIVGSAPTEMIELFGYNPVVQLDIGNAGNHLMDILNRYESYQDLIERNYLNLAKYHTWEHRWMSVLDVINTNY